MKGYGRVWTEERVRTELLKAIDTLGIKRMPTSTELKMLGSNDLHLKVSRTRKYRGWAEFLGLPLKSSTTLSGQINEDVVEGILVNKGFKVERMTTKHPYDLLINDTVKVDAKTARPYLVHGSRTHTFGISKPDPTCDIYICLALDEQEEIERTLVIPSHHLRVQTLCIGRESKYNKFDKRWDYIELYTNFYKGVV